MKRILPTIAVFLSSAIAGLWGFAQEHTLIAYIALGIAGFILLYALSWLIKILWRLIGKSLTSLVFMTALAGICFTLSWHKLINPLAGLCVGLITGLAIAILLIRMVGSKAQYSIIFGEIFAFLTSYMVKAYIKRETIQTAEDVEAENNDYKNIVLVLSNQMGYTKQQAKLAADYVMQTLPLKSSLEEKIKQALQFKGRNN